MGKTKQRTLADMSRYVEAKQKYGRVIAGMKSAESDKAAAVQDKLQHSRQAEIDEAAAAFLDGADVTVIDTVQSIDERIAAADRQYEICRAAKPAATKELRKAENVARAELMREYAPGLRDKRSEVQAIAKQLLQALDDENNAWHVARKAGAAAPHAVRQPNYSLKHALKQLCS